MLNWLYKNKEWFFQGGGVTVLVAAAGCGGWLFSATTATASSTEKSLLIVLLANCIVSIAIIFFLLFRAAQAQNSRTELMRRLDAMDKKLKSIEAPRRFDDWDQAQPEIQRLITNSFEDFPSTELQCLGVALHVSWKTVRECLERYHKQRGRFPKATVRLKVLCGSWHNFDKLGRAWRRRNEAFYESATEFLQLIRGNTELQVIVCDYDYTPNWHGVLINGRHLFRSSCLYRDNEFTVHKNPYVYFRQEESEYSDMQISEFLHWFQHESRERTLDDLNKTQASFNTQSHHP